MQINTTKKIQNEFNRLQLLGWSHTQPNYDGVRVIDEIDESKISFPSRNYELDPDASEAKGIWAEFRANKIAGLMDEHGIDLIWEVGAGHGNVAIPLREHGITTIAIEPLYSGAKVLANNGICVFGATLDQLELPDSSIKAIGLFDVLEHLENPNQLLDEVYRVLAPAGILITSVPCYQWLFSEFDIRVGHFRRYSRRTLKATLLKSCFSDTRMTNMFFSLIFPAFIIRRIPFLLGIRSKKNSQSPASQPKIFKYFESVLIPIFNIETKFKFPFGLSLVSLSRK